MTRCTACNHENREAARFCESCGARLDTGSPKRVERKVVTVLFADLVGFTGRAEAMDVEDVERLLTGYHDLVREQLERRGGAVEKFIGDAVMAVFGAPAAHEDDPERAVRAAFAIRDGVAAARAAEPELDLHVRIGITSGEALVNLDVRPDEGRTFASGDVVNTAARLQASAGTDRILVGEPTHVATADLIVYEEHAPVDAKGKRHPVPCWEAVRPRSRIGRERAQPATRMVGRGHERRQLLDAFDRVRSGPGVERVTVSGVPGIGKSRLVWELFDHLDGLPELIRWRQGRSLPYGHDVAFLPLSDMVKAEIGLLDSDDAATAVARLEASVSHAARDPEEAAWMTRHLGSLVGLPVEADAAGDRRAEVFAAWRRYLERLAERTPTVLVFEDVHWAADALLDFVEDLARWTSGVPLLIVCTTRPELIERRPSLGSGTHIALRPLTDGETLELLGTLAGEAVLPAGTVETLLAGAAGNPLYAQEFLRLLTDQGLLSPGGGDGRLAAIEALPVPGSVRDIIAARLDALAAEDKELLAAAAVVGRACWTGAVAAVAARDRWSVEETLRRLEERQFLRRRKESVVEGETEFVFEHSLIREVAYRGILRPQRAERHRLAAEWLASLGGDPRDRADAIADHYVNALEHLPPSSDQARSLSAAASSALAAAAARARALYDVSAAAELYGRAADLAAPGDPRRPRLLLEQGLAAAMADVPAERTLAAAATALANAGDMAGAAEAESALGWLASLRGRSAEARDHDERAVELIAGEGDSAAKAIVLSRAATHVITLPEHRAAALGRLQEALAIAVRLGMRELEAETLQFVGLSRLDGGDLDGMDDLEAALALGIELSSPVSLSCYGNLADARQFQGALGECARLHSEGLAAAHRFSMPLQIRRFTAGRAADLYYAGDWEGALAHLDSYLDAVQTGSPHYREGEARIVRGRIRLARGLVQDAADDAAAAAAFARCSGEPFDVFPAVAFRGRVQLEQGNDVSADAEELLTLLRSSQPFWAACGIPDALPVLAAAGRLSELRPVAETGAAVSHWYVAALQVIDGDPERAAETYRAIGSLPDARALSPAAGAPA